MNHPTPEQWVPYVYGETSRTARRQLSAHLSECPQCRQEVDTWKRNLHRLDAWKLPAARATLRAGFLPALRWATAAAVLLMMGILIGRASAPKVDTEKFRAAITPEIRRELQGELAQLAREEVARAASFSLASSRRYTDQMAQQLYVVVKKDIDTLAVNADAGLRHTAQQLFQLADFKQPQSEPAPDQ
jgi:hypothetical protein